MKVGDFMQEEKVAFGVREIRACLGLSLENFSLAVGISVGHLNNIEKNVRPMTRETAGKIADALENMIDSVVKDGDLKKRVDINVKKMGAKYFNKDDDNQEKTNNANKVQTEIIPELLLASCIASFYRIQVQDEVYKYLINIEKNKLYLKYIEENGENVPNEYAEEIERKMSTSIKDIFDNLLKDDYYKKSLYSCSLAEEIREKASIYKHGLFRTPDQDFEEYMGGGDEEA